MKARHGSGVVADARRLGLPRSIWGVFALVSLGLGAVTAGLLGASGKVSFTGVAAARSAAACRRGAAAAAATRIGAAAATDAAAGEPGVPALLEPGPFGPLPRIAADGRRPFLAYARPFDADDPRPQIALLILGLGLQAEQTETALRLPGEVACISPPMPPTCRSWWLAPARRVTRCCSICRWSLPTILPAIPARTRCWPAIPVGGQPRAARLAAGARAGLHRARRCRHAVRHQRAARRRFSTRSPAAASRWSRSAPALSPAARLRSDCPMPALRSPSTRIRRCASIDHALAGLETEALASGTRIGGRPRLSGLARAAAPVGDHARPTRAWCWRRSARS